VKWFEMVEDALKTMGWREELESLVEEPRTVEGNFGRG
jgi:hypothetical protein